ncbi:MAG TPA: cytochrome P450 [Acidimicrobiales bacterium]|nr:cytochrome P450 [Acidimicrobiales bacterium]
MTTTTGARLIEPDFWRQPLDARMAEFIELREAGPFTSVSFENLMSGETEHFQVATRYADVVEISKRPKEFCSGQGAVSIPDLPAEALDFFGSFINMDDPRHARQRGIVARSFTPRQLQNVLDSVETICTEVIDGFCEQGDVDLVKVMSQPFPLLIICDMMGIPRSEFDTVLKATNVILGAGDPEFLGDGDPMNAIFEAGISLTTLMNDLAEQRRSNPTDDLTSKLVHNDLGEDMLAPNEIAPFFILLAVAGNDTTRTAISHGMHLLSQNPEQRRIWQEDLDRVTPTAVEEIVRVASPVTFMRRTATTDVTISGHDFSKGDKVVLLYGVANRDPRVFVDPEKFDVLRDPNPHVGFGGPGPHFCLGAHLARREVSVAFRQLLTRLPDIEVTGEPVPLESMGIPLVGGIKRLPVRFTPTASVGA